jgi:hypothetical protein
MTCYASPRACRAGTPPPGWCGQAVLVQAAAGRLTSAIKEYGALWRTVYAARYLADETYRRCITRQLNKGENLHARRRSLAYAGEGAVLRRHHEQQTEQMWCLTLATNAIVCWSTEYHGLGVAALRRAGQVVDDAVLAHIWPTHHENVHFYGTHSVGAHSVDIDGRAGPARCRRLPAVAPTRSRDRLNWVMRYTEPAGAAVAAAARSRTRYTVGRDTSNSSASSNSSAMLCSPAACSFTRCACRWRRQLRRPTFELSLGSGHGRALAGTHPQQVDLEFGERGEDVEEHFAHGVGWVVHHRAQLQLQLQLQAPRHQ